MATSIRSLALAFVWLLAPFILAQEPAVKMWEEPLVVPTYEAGAAERNPVFYSGRTYQGAKGKIYPYPLYETISETRHDKTYVADFVENKYIKVCVLPELGGRIFSAEDKTDSYDFFYHQHVIKPALIGMIGAWISGGVEWNIPHHHRASSFLPVDHRLVENPDGSSTIWVGEVELRHRMKWLVGITLFPDKSYLEVTTKLFNRTPFAHSFLDFTNAAVHAGPEYQVIFPPRVEFATQHGKWEFAHWPIAREVYGGTDYTRGVDISWWKNNPNPVSFFAWNVEDDFFGGYDHGKRAGVVVVKDHNVAPGSKFFEWGNGDEGRMWDKILTDTDGPYLELMAGNYSDNQPDYSWIQPAEVKSARQYWYPVREIGGVKNANLNGAVNLEVDSGGTIRFGFNATSEFQSAKVRLLVRDRTLFEQVISIGPDKPFAKELLLPTGVKEEDLKVSLLDSSNEELISYQPLKPGGAPMPEPVRPPGAPKDLKTVDELYQAGLRLEQFHSPALEPYPYYEEALARDPRNYEVNTALGRLYCERGLYKLAEERLNIAIRRAAHDHTRPKDGEAYYYLGVALKAERKNATAEDAFNRAAWSMGWQAASYYALAELASQKTDWSRALGYLDRSLAVDTLDARAWDLKAAVLRKMGRQPEAEQASSQAMACDPLDSWAAHELSLLRAGKVDSHERSIKVGDELQAALELAVDYANAGLIEEAFDVLDRFVASRSDRNRLNPLVSYYLGYFTERSKQPREAAKYYRLASQMPSDYVFPFRLESIDVLRSAMASNPSDARAPYYLGNLLFDIQPEAAIKAWEQSAALDGSQPTVHRNLALAYAQIEDNIPKAVASMEKALALNKNDGRYYYERDVLYEMGNVPSARRLAALEENLAAVSKRSDVLARLIRLHVVVGQYDRAIDLLGSHHFHNWEGEGEIHRIYMDAHTQRAARSLAQHKYGEALADFEAALEYPENLEVGRPLRGERLPQVYWLMGLCHEAIGHSDRARELYQQAAQTRDDDPEMRYYQGLADLKLGEKEQARRTFNELIKSGLDALASTDPVDYFSKFGAKQSGRVRAARAHYWVGLGNLGKGDRATAKIEFQKALELDANHLGARAQLAEFEVHGASK